MDHNCKENITYMLNVLKSKINEIEKNKTILHIFNSKYILDKKEIENFQLVYLETFILKSFLFFN